MPCAHSKEAARAAIAAAATAKEAVRPLAQTIKKLREKIARWREHVMTKLAFEHEEELLQDIWELEQEVKEPQHRQ